MILSATDCADEHTAFYDIHDSKGFLRSVPVVCQVILLSNVRGPQGKIQAKQFAQ